MVDDLAKDEIHRQYFKNLRSRPKPTVALAAEDDIVIIVVVVVVCKYFRMV
jgi:hypothetical protein